MTEEKPEYIVSTDGKPLRCPECLMIWGYVRKKNGLKVLRVEMGGMAVESAMSMEVWCACGHVLKWHAGQEAIDELVERVRKSRAVINGG
jgi:hypothetical protein